MSRDQRQRLRVLCVDYDDDNRLIAELSLQLDPTISVKSIPTVEEAQKACRAITDFDVALVDSGSFSKKENVVLDWLLQAGPCGKLPLILLTTDTWLVEQHQLLGAIGTVLKPFDPLNLAALVRSIYEGAATNSS